MIQEALDYFGGDTGYHRLFSLFKKKYESLGRFGGTVKIDGFREGELEGVARFFGETASELHAKGKISLLHFEKQLQQTKFEGMALKELLEAYFQEALLSNKEKKQLKDVQLSQLFSQMEADFPKLLFWLQYIQRKTPDTYWIYRLIDGTPLDFKLMVSQLNDAFTQMPDDFERFPMFSQRITRNPHAFDYSTNLGRLFIHLLSVDHFGAELDVVPSDSEGMNDLLLHYRILRDDITNYVTCVNLLAEVEGQVHPMWRAATETHSVMNAPLRELLKMKRIYPASEKTVWVVENSGVYSSILDKVPHVPLICTHGQFKLAALHLMDMLVKEECTIYYASDIDPEGIGMADRLLKRYPDHVRLWRMGLEDYLVSQSGLELSNERLAKLNSITTPLLKPVIDELWKRKKAGYQEALVDDMVRDI